MIKSVEVASIEQCIWGLGELEEWIKKAKEAIPEEHLHKAEVAIEAYEVYDMQTTRVSVNFVRPETEEEIKARSIGERKRLERALISCEMNKRDIQGRLEALNEGDS